VTTVLSATDLVVLTILASITYITFLF
jgi:hypothetical protein